MRTILDFEDSTADPTAERSKRHRPAASATGRPLSLARQETLAEESAPTLTPPTRTPFPRMERALQASASAESVAAVPARRAADPFAELIDLRRHQRASRRVLVDAGSDAVRDVRRRERNTGACSPSRTPGRLCWPFTWRSMSPAARPASRVLGGSAAVVVAAKVGGLYDRDELVIEHSTLNELPRLVNLAAMVALLFWIAGHFLVVGAPNTENLLALWLLLIVGLVAGPLRAPVSWRGASLRSSAACSSAAAASSESSIRSSPRYTRVELVGVVKAEEIANDHLRLREIAERDHVHRIIIDTDAASPAATFGIVRAANATGLQVSLLPSMLDRGRRLGRRSTMSAASC